MMVMKLYILMENLSLFQSDELEKLKLSENLDELCVYKIQNKVVILVKATNDIIMKQFKDISSCLSEYIDEFLIDNYERWNTYILFLSTNDISVDNLVEVRNNKFFARKFLIGNYTNKLTAENIMDLLNQEILFNDLLKDSTQLLERILYIIYRNPYKNLKDLTVKSNLLNFIYDLCNQLKSSNNIQLKMPDNFNWQQKLSIIDLICSLVYYHNFKINIITNDENFVGLIEKKLSYISIKTKEEKINDYNELIIVTKYSLDIQK